tara:strand:- start:397 stop:633 length:237 start_codon:yes stop_codon:yes gene_type:complete
MTAKLEFDLEDPDDRVQHLRCVSALDMACVIFEIQRNVRKHMTNQNTPKEYIEGVEDTLNYINELIYDQGINIDNLIS